ncbi:MAG TPA: GIY-YIG nuclease family protein [Cyclobacteriaceae bacterium]|nr:GIY-YIG nuclease family protein [Cyclobacteriaceae bacterium]
MGYTSDLEARLNSHNVLATKGFTVKYWPWILVYSEKFDSKKDALKLERELKSGRGREFIWKIIEQQGL